MQEELQTQLNGFYLNLILGSNLNVSLLTKTEKFKDKQEYEGFKWNITILICVLALISWMWPFRVFDSILCFLMVWYYCTLTIRESVLRVNGSKIEGWWLSHHYLSCAVPGIVLTWKDGLCYQEFRPYFLVFTFYISLAQLAQNQYQSGCLRRLHSLGQGHQMDITVEGFTLWQFKGLTFLLLFLTIRYLFQLFLDWKLFGYTNTETCDGLWQVWTLSILLGCIAGGNIVTTSMVCIRKLKTSPSYINIVALTRKYSSRHKITQAPPTFENATSSSSSQNPQSLRNIWIHPITDTIKDENREKVMKNDLLTHFMEHSKAKHHRRVVSYLCDTFGMLITKIGMDNFESVSERAFNLLYAKIDPVRADANWKRLGELLPSVKSKNSGSEDCYEMFQAEITLETYLDQLGEIIRPSKEHIDKLSSAEQLLHSALKEHSKVLYSYAKRMKSSEELVANSEEDKKREYFEREQKEIFKEHRYVKFILNRNLKKLEDEENLNRSEVLMTLCQLKETLNEITKLKQENIILHNSININCCSMDIQNLLKKNKTWNEISVLYKTSNASYKILSFETRPFVKLLMKNRNDSCLIEFDTTKTAEDLIEYVQNGSSSSTAPPFKLEHYPIIKFEDRLTRVAELMKQMGIKTDLGTVKGDSVVFTPIVLQENHEVVKIHREETAKSDKVFQSSGGQHIRVVINQFDQSSKFDFSESDADVSLSFSVHSTDKNLKQVQEKRSLFFKLRGNADLDVGRAMVHKFFKNLLCNLPGDYASFMKRAMTLLHKEYNEIAQVVIHNTAVEEAEIAIPAAAQYDSGSELKAVTIGHVQEVLEHAFPNGLPTSKISKCLKCSDEEILQYLHELETIGIIRHVGDEWIRCDTKNQDESIEESGVGGTYRNETNSGSEQQPTVAIISCLFVEKQAVDALIEESSTIHKYKSRGESNVYTLGRIGQHRVVATKVALIGYSHGTSAGSITTRLLGNFQNIEHVFIVGVGGAVPNFTDATLHARLGDVIVSASRQHQYVYAHELLFDRHTEKITGSTVQSWNAEDKTIEKIVETGGQELRNSWNLATEDAIRLLASSAGDVEWKSPPESTDVLAMAVSKGNVVVLPHPNENRQGGAEIHLGTVGAMSAMKKHKKTGGGEEVTVGQLRLSFAESFGIRCMDVGFDSVVGAVVGSGIGSWALIRGISDYHNGQSRAGKVWQAHAAVRAAGMVRCIIEKLPKSD